MNPRIQNERKNSFCVSLKITFKDNHKPTDWVSHSKLCSLDTFELFERTPKFDEKQASVYGNKEE